MLNIYIYNVLYILLRNTYIEEIPKFWLELISKETDCSSKYFSKINKIKIFNLSREYKNILITGIRELAHHSNYYIYGGRGYDSTFYLSYKELLEKSIEMGFLSYDYIKNNLDEKNWNSIIVKAGSIENKELKNNSDLILIKIRSSFNEKEKLVKNNYLFNRINSCWEKIIENGNKEKEYSFLKEIILEENIFIEKIDVSNFSPVYYLVATGDTYSHKDFLNKNGYKYKGYGFKDKDNWVKKVTIHELNKEEEFLNVLYGVTYRIK